jgi:uncharacterized protein
MTPEERNLITELFDRLATLEDAARDPDAERAIKEGLRQAPNAAYALVQTTLVQDEALKRADARIRELEAGLGVGNESAARPAGFLDSMRGALFGRSEPSRAGSVPSVRPGEVAMGGPDSYRPGMAPGMASGMGPGMAPGPGGMEPGRPGGSFLGTAAAAAAGVIGGSMLLGGIRSMMGGHQQPSTMGGFDSGGAARAATPWSNSSGGGDLARQAGLDDIGRAPSGSSAAGAGSERGQGLFNTAEDTADDVADADNDSGNDFDAGFDDGGGDGDE